MRNLSKVSYCLPKRFRNHTICSALYRTILVGNTKPSRGFAPNFSCLKLFVIDSGHFFEFFRVVRTELKMVLRIETNSKPFLGSVLCTKPFFRPKYLFEFGAALFCFQWCLSNLSSELFTFFLTFAFFSNITCLSMAEWKVPLDTVIKQLSDTLNQHDNTIRRLESSVESMPSQTHVSLNTFCTENQDKIRSLQTNLTSLIESKDALWTQLSDNMLSVTNGLREIKVLLPPQPTTPSPLPEQTPSDHSSIDAHPQPPPTSFPLVPTPTVAPYAILQPNSPTTTIVLPPTTSIPTFWGKPTKYPRQFLLRIEQYTCTVNHWSHDNLLRGISQFLKDDALEWYCQLYHTKAFPTDWSDFCTRFLTQFHSPIRIAPQEEA